MRLVDDKGRPTAYGLACGYVERVSWDETDRTLWREGGCYHVREHRFGHGRVYWQTFRSLTDARSLLRTKRPTQGPVLPCP